MKEFYALDRYVTVVSESFEKDETLPADGYELRVDDKGRAYGRYQSERAKTYLTEEWRKWKKQEVSQEIYCKDYPSFPIRGVVEGYYGKPLSFGQRKDLFAFMKECRMNFYIYAPKDDLYHREKWRLPYPAAALEELRETAEIAKENYVNFCFAISPGKDFDFAEETDYKVLLEKLTAVTKLGITCVALFMDDIEPTLSPKAQERFSSPAAAHACLANYLAENLALEEPLFFCPTEYMQNFDTPYRQALRETLREDIRVFWTGYNTAAEVVTEEDGETVCKTFGRKPVLWDNYPVNDFNPKRRVYLGAISGRGRYLPRTHIGYFANLSELYESNKIPLCTMAEYAWDSETYRPQEALERATARYFKGCVKEGRLFVRLNESNVTAEKNVVKDYVEKENFRALDKHYAAVRDALETLTKRAPTPFVEELSELFEFANAECSLYFAFRKGMEAEKTDMWKRTMNESRYATADLSFLRYLNEKYDLEEPFTIDAKRQIYRRWNIDDGESIR